jgi:putative transposase
MGINRSSFYKWKERMEKPSQRMIKRISDIKLFSEYHDRYPNHGYRWLNRLIRNELGVVMSDQYAHKCCKNAGIKSISKHYHYKKPGNPFKIYPNLLMADFEVNGPFECVVTDMTAFWCNETYWELTLFMDLWNNEIVAYGLSDVRGDPSTYHEGLTKLLEKKKEYKDLKLILHSDQGAVYSSKSFNKLLPSYNIIRSMSRAGTPTDNAAMEAINGWVKEELFNDFRIKESDDVRQTVEDYIIFFNEKRPAYALNYLTPKQVKDVYFSKCACV